MISQHRPTDRARAQAGSSYVETLVASMFLGISLLSLCSMFLLGYSRVATAGKTTMGVSATRQLLEDMRLIPFDQLANLNGLDTDDSGTLPAGGPELEVARRWRYALAGSGEGWTFTPAELARWTDLAVQGDPLRARGRITIVPRSATLSEVDITVSVPGRIKDIRISTLITRL